MGEYTHSRKDVVVAAMWGMSRLKRHLEHRQERPEGQKDQLKILPPSTPPPPWARAYGRQPSKGTCRWGGGPHRCPQALGCLGFLAHI